MEVFSVYSCFRLLYSVHHFWHSAVLVPLSVIHFFLVLSSIPLYDCPAIYWSSFLLIQFLAILSDTWDFHRCRLSLLLDKYAREVPGEVNVPFLKKPPGIFFKVAAPFVVGGFRLLPIFANISVVSLFHLGHSGRYIVVSTFSFNFDFPD